jgi:RimJ/RimL family protein N-acetyltransferase
VDQERDRTTERQVASRGVYRTERLRLVPINAGHASELWELHQDEGIARWFPMSREQALRFAERMESSWSRGVGKWLAYEESTGAFVGRGGPSWATLEGVEYVEIGWALRKEFWGRGYATEIGQAGLDHAFSVQGIEQVVSFTEIHNALARGDGAPGDALRPPDPAAGSDRRIGHSARGGTVRALPDYPRRPVDPNTTVGEAYVILKDHSLLRKG